MVPSILAITSRSRDRDYVRIPGLLLSRTASNDSLCDGSEARGPPHLISIRRCFLLPQVSQLVILHEEAEEGRIIPDISQPVAAVGAAVNNLIVVRDVLMCGQK